MNNDALPGISLSVSPTSVGEGAGATSVDVTASLVGSTRFKGSRTVRVSAPSGGSNISYSSSPSNFDVTISGSSASGTEDFTLTPVDDVYYTGDETVTVDADASWGSFEASAAVTIVNNDALPEIRLSVSPTSVGEGAGATSVDVTASLVGSTRFKGSRTVRVSAPSGGSNISYSSSPSNFDVTISGSSASGTEDFTLTPVDDVYYTGDETVTVDAVASWGSFEAAAAVTIVNNDALPEIRLSVSPTSVGEGAGATSVDVTASLVGSTRFKGSRTVRVSAPSGGSNISYSSSPSNFDVTISGSSASGTEDFTLTPVDDVYYTGDETVTVDAVASWGSFEASAEVMIVNNDALPEIRLSVSPTSVGEGAGATSVDVTASLVGSTRFKGSRTVRVSAPSGGSNISYSSSPSNFDVTISGSSASGTEDFTLTPT